MKRIILLVVIFVLIGMVMGPSAAQDSDPPMMVVTFRQTGPYSGDFFVSVLRGSTPRFSVELTVNEVSIGEYKIPKLEEGDVFQVAPILWNEPIKGYGVRYIAPPYEWE